MRGRTGLWVLAAALTLTAGVVFAQRRPGGAPAPPRPPRAAPNDAAVQKRLDDTIVSFTFTDQPVLEALDFLQTLGGVNIVPDRSKLKPDATVTLKLNNVPLATALKLLTQQLGLRYVVRNGVVFISDAASTKPPRVRKLYDVRRLIEPIRGDADEAVLRAAMDELVNLVRITVAPDAWPPDTGIAGCTPARTLVVTQDPEIQKDVGNLLNKLTVMRDQLRH